MTGRIIVDADISSGSVDVTINADDGSTVSTESFSATSTGITSFYLSVSGNDYWIDTTINGNARLRNIWVDTQNKNLQTFQAYIDGRFENNSIIYVYEDDIFMDVIRLEKDVKKYSFKAENSGSNIHFETDLYKDDKIEDIVFNMRSDLVASQATALGDFSSGKSYIRTYTDGEFASIINLEENKNNYTVNTSSNASNINFEIDLHDNDTLNGFETEVQSSNITGFGDTQYANINTLESTTTISLPDIQKANISTKDLDPYISSITPLSPALRTKSIFTTFESTVINKKGSGGDIQQSVADPRTNDKGKITTPLANGLEATRDVIGIAELEKTRADIISTISDGDLSISFNQGNKTYTVDEFDNTDFSSKSEILTGISPIAKSRFDVDFNVDFTGDAQLHKVDVYRSGLYNNTSVSSLGILPNLELTANSYIKTGFSNALDIRTSLVSIPRQRRTLQDVQINTNILEGYWRFIGFKTSVNVNTLKAFISILVEDPYQSCNASSLEASGQNLAYDLVYGDEYGDKYITPVKAQTSSTAIFKSISKVKNGSIQTADVIPFEFTTGNIQSANASILSTTHKLTTYKNIKQTLQGSKFDRTLIPKTQLTHIPSKGIGSSNALEGDIINVSIPDITLAEVSSNDIQFSLGVGSKTLVDGLVRGATPGGNIFIQANRPKISSNTTVGQKIFLGIPELAQITTFSAALGVRVETDTGLATGSSLQPRFPQLSTDINTEQSSGIGLIPLQILSVSTETKQSDASPSIPNIDLTSTINKQNIESSKLFSSSSLIIDPGIESLSLSTFESKYLALANKQSILSTPLIVEGPKQVSKQSFVATPVEAIGLSTKKSVVETTESKANINQIRSSLITGDQIHTTRPGSILPKTTILANTNTQPSEGIGISPNIDLLANTEKQSSLSSDTTISSILTTKITPQKSSITSDKAKYLALGQKTKISTVENIAFGGFVALIKVNPEKVVTNTTSITTNIKASQFIQQSSSNAFSGPYSIISSKSLAKVLSNSIFQSSSLTTYPIIQSSEANKIQSRSSLTTKSVIQTSNVTRVTDNKQYGYGIKTLVTAEARLPRPISIVSPTKSFGKPITPDISIKTTGKISSSISDSNSITTNISSIINITKSTSNAIFDSSSILTDKKKSKADYVPLFNSVDIVTGLDSTISSVTPFEGFYVAIGSKPTAEIDPRVLGFSFTQPIKTTANQLEITTSLFVNTNTKLSQSDSILPILDISIIGDKTKTSGNIPPTTEKITTYTNIKQYSNGNTLKPSVNSLKTKNAIHPSSGNPLEATKLIVSKSICNPLEATLSVIESATSNTLTANIVKVTTGIDKELVNASGIESTLGSVKIFPQKTIIDTTEKQLAPVDITTQNIIQSVSTSLSDLFIKSITTKNILTDSISKPSTGTYSAKGLPTLASVNTKNAIYLKAEIQTITSTGNDIRTSITSSINKQFVSSFTKNMVISGDPILAGTKEKAKVNPFNAKGTEITQISFRNPIKSTATPLDLFIQSITTDNITQKSSVQDIPETTKLIINSGIQNITSKPLILERIIPGTATLVSYNALEAKHIPTQDKQIINTNRLDINTTLTAKLQKVQINTTPTFDLAFPHNARLRELEFLSPTPLIGGRPFIPGDITQSQGRPILAYEIDSISYSNPTISTSSSLPGAKAMYSSVDINTTEAEQGKFGFIVQAKPLIAKNISAVEATGLKTTASKNFPVDKRIRRSTNERVGYTNYNFTKDTVDLTENISVFNYYLKSTGADIRYSQAEPYQHINKDAISQLRDVYNGRKNDIEKLEHRLRVRGQQGGATFIIDTFRDALSDLKSALKNLDSKINDLVKQDQFNQLSPEFRVYQPDEGSDYNSPDEAIDYSISTTYMTDLILTSYGQIQKAESSTLRSDIEEVDTTKANIDSIEAKRITAKITTIKVLTTLPLMELGYPEIQQLKMDANPLELAVSNIIVTPPKQTATIDDIWVRKICEAESRYLTPKVDIQGTTGTITKASSYFPVDGASDSGIPDSAEGKETRKHTYIDEREGYQNSQFLMTVAVEGLSTDSTRSTRTCSYINEDGDRIRTNCPSENPGASDDWEVSGLPEGYYEAFPVAGGNQQLIDDYPKTDQKFAHEIKWGYPGAGYGIHMGISVNEQQGIRIVDSDKITGNRGGIVFEVYGVEGEWSKISGNVSIENDVIPKKWGSISTTTATAWSKTEGSSFEKAEGGITTANTKSLTDYAFWWLNHGQKDEYRLEPTSIESTWKTLKLSFEMSRQDFNETLAPIRKDSGSISTFESSDGGFRSVGLSRGNNSIDVYPKSSLTPLRYPETMLVKNISAEERNNKWSQLNVTVKLQRKENKRARFGNLGGIETGTKWQFEFDNYTVTTNDISTKVKRRSSKGIKSANINIRANLQQAALIQRKLTKQNAILIENWGSDKDRTIKDLTSDNSNTITIDPPKETGILQQGDYLVKRWRSKWVGGTYYNIELELIPKEL